MTPNDLYYKTKPIRIETKDLYVLSSLIEQDVGVSDIDWDKYQNISIHYYIDEMFDGCRGLAVYSVWYEGQPFVLCMDAGRDNRDIRRHFITDADTYKRFLQYVVSLYIEECTDRGIPTQADKHTDFLETCYGYKLNYENGTVARVN